MTELGTGRTILSPSKPQRMPMPNGIILKPRIHKSFISSNLVA